MLTAIVSVSFGSLDMVGLGAPDAPSPDPSPVALGANLRYTPHMVHGTTSGLPYSSFEIVTSFSFEMGIWTPCDTPTEDRAERAECLGPFCCCERRSPVG